MEITDYFMRNVLENPDRLGVTKEMCEEVVERPEYSERQPNGRFAHWTRDAGRSMYLPVVVTGDRRSLHNAFFDSNSTRKQRRQNES